MFVRCVMRDAVSNAVTLSHPDDDDDAATTATAIKLKPIAAGKGRKDAASRHNNFSGVCELRFCLSQWFDRGPRLRRARSGGHSSPVRRHKTKPHAPELHAPHHTHTMHFARASLRRVDMRRILANAARSNFMHTRRTRTAT